MNIAEWLWRTARLTPRAPALLTGTQLEADYHEFANRAAAIAMNLRANHGIKPGARLGVYMENRTQYLEVLYGIWWAGGVAVPINAKLHPKEVLWILNNAEADLVFASDASAADLRAANNPQTAAAAPNSEAAAPTADSSTPTVLSVDAPDFAQMRRLTSADRPPPTPREDADLAWLFYTSGTTGKPKGVMLTNGNLIAMSSCYPIDVTAPAPTDAALYAAPLSHGAGLYNFIHVRVGARHVVPASRRFDANEILDLSRALAAPDNRDPVTMFAAPTMLCRLVKAASQRGLSGQGIGTIVYGGAPMYVADIIEAVQIMGPRFVQIYGLGESPMTITSLSRAHIAERTHPRWRQRLGSAGVAQSCMSLRIIDEDGADLPIGETGEVLASGAAVMAGYWRNDDASARTLQEGWLHTGDIGSLDDDGFLTLSDRATDVIISGGSNIYPREIEEVLLTHDSVGEVAVVGRPHQDWGEEVVAFIVPRDGVPFDTAALDRHCLENIARFKRPKQYFTIDELPKNNYGKVLKRTLRARLRDGDFSQPQ